jgi:hypothetical protein
MKKLLVGLLLSTSFLFGQIGGAFQNFFKYSTVYAGFNLASPKWEEDRYSLSMIDPETGEENWLSGELNVHKEERDLDPDFDLSFGIRKIARFNYEPKRGVKNAGVGGDWYKGSGQENPNEAATIGRVKGFEYLIKYSENRRWDEQFRSQEYFLRYLGNWFIAKIKYQDLEMEDLRFGQADFRLRKEFSSETASFNISFGLSGRSHPVYGFAPTIIDTSWYSSAWWDFAEDEFGVDDMSYSIDLDGDGVPDGEGFSIYDNSTGEYVGFVGYDWRWFDADGELMAMTDREFYQYHFPGLLEKWFNQQVKDLGNQREISVSLGIDYYKYTDNHWFHIWGSIYPYHYGMDKYSFHNAIAFSEHEEDGNITADFEFLEAGTEIWYDYDIGAVIGFKLQENLGFYVEGKYLDYWERPAYDIKVGLNYQFVGFSN